MRLTTAKIDRMVYGIALSLENQFHPSEIAEILGFEKRRVARSLHRLRVQGMVRCITYGNKTKFQLN